MDGGFVLIVMHVCVLYKDGSWRLYVDGGRVLIVINVCVLYKDGSWPLYVDGGRILIVRHVCVCTTTVVGCLCGRWTCSYCNKCMCFAYRR